MSLPRKERAIKQSMWVKLISTLTNSGFQSIAAHIVDKASIEIQYKFRTISRPKGKHAEVIGKCSVDK